MQPFDPHGLQGFKSTKEVYAFGYFLFGLGSAGVLWLRAKGHNQAATQITLAAAVVGAFIGAAYVLEK